jgi:hypothetical protein
LLTDQPGTDRGAAADVMAMLGPDLTFGYRLDVGCSVAYTSPGADASASHASLTDHHKTAAENH